MFPNYINGKKVKKISGNTTGSTSWKAMYFSIWNKGICDKINNSDISCGYSNEQGTITKVIISPGIEEIEAYAFQLSYALEEIIISDTVNIIGKCTFRCCPNLRKINIPKKIDKLEEGIFQGCGIESIVIPNNVKRIENGVFWHCEELVDIQIPKTVEYIGDCAFYYCDSLENITIPDSVTNIGDDAFGNCTSLTNITIPSSVTTMGANVFYSIPAITVNVPFKEGETPEGWDAGWNDTSTGNNITVNYLK